jgi:hypothetical protein
MFRGDHVHDDAALQHLCQALFYGESTGLFFHNKTPYKMIRLQILPLLLIQTDPATTMIEG